MLLRTKYIIYLSSFVFVNTKNAYCTKIRYSLHDICKLIKLSNFKLHIYQTLTSKDHECIKIDKVQINFWGQWVLIFKCKASSIVFWKIKCFCFLLRYSLNALCFYILIKRGCSTVLLGVDHTTSRPKMTGTKSCFSTVEVLYHCYMTLHW